MFLLLIKYLTDPIIGHVVNDKPLINMAQIHLKIESLHGSHHAMGIENASMVIYLTELEHL